MFEFPVTEGGIYPVQLQITDANGCVNVVNRQIEIQSMFNLFIPTSFTPNNDGYNDAFFVEGTDIDPDRFEFEIWNRWGELIWSTTDPTDAWYGQVGEEGNTTCQTVHTLTASKSTASKTKASERRSLAW